MADQRTTYTPPGGTTVIETRRSRGLGIVMFILIGVVAVLAILWFALGVPEDTSLPAGGVTNSTPDNGQPPAGVTGDTAPMTPTEPAPAPMTPDATAPDATAPDAAAPGALIPAPVEN